VIGRAPLAEFGRDRRLPSSNGSATPGHRFIAPIPRGPARGHLHNGPPQGAVMDLCNGPSHAYLECDGGCGGGRRAHSSDEGTTCVINGTMTFE
jgi:hypothetical protein